MKQKVLSAIAGLIFQKTLIQIRGSLGSEHYIGMQIPEKILVLIQKYQEGSLTNDERALLDDWYQSFNQETTDLSASGYANSDELSRQISAKLEATIRSRKPKERSRYRRMRLPAAAAMIILLLSMGVFWHWQSGQPSPLIAVKPVKLVNDLTPGGNKATLVLDDGSVILLDSARNGMLGEQGVSSLEKKNRGSITYSLNEDAMAASAKVYYNTITTPRGGEFQVTLADGTKVWLNAASSIRFPTSFNGDTRSVHITGEVYFEVAHNAKQPFIVQAGQSAIEVLGTHFNVNAYDDENHIKTSLLEGSVKISIPGQSAGKSQLLKPGEQAQVSRNGQIQLTKDMDPEEVLGWKNGLFVFKSTDLRTIMRQLSRWYDVDIQYQGDVDMRFTGQITRNNNVSKVFEKLELTGELRFRVEGNKIIVSR